jgi:hypothetical protein
VRVLGEGLHGKVLLVQDSKAIHDKDKYYSQKNFETQEHKSIQPIILKEVAFIRGVKLAMKPLFYLAH